MRTAVLGLGDLYIDNLDDYIPEGTHLIISGGTGDIGICVRNYALKKPISLEEIFPDYKKYGRRAPYIRNIKIIKRADRVLLFWDGTSRGTAFIINECNKQEVPIRIIRISKHAAPFII